ncbi:MAG: GxxExxY protein, partial [bacterium]
MRIAAMQINANTGEKEIVEKDLSYKIMGILFGVHSALGGRYQEKYYQRAVETGLKHSGLKYAKELEAELNYEGDKIGKYRLDFLVEEKIIVELKTVPVLGREEYRQVKAYLKSSGLRLGILANFRGPRLQYKRILNPQKSVK